VKRLLFAAILLLPFATMAQKNIDLDKFRFTAEFRSLPYMLVDSSYHTYNVNVEATRLMQGYLANMDPEQSVYLEGWKHLSKDGHLQVMVKLEDLIPESFSVKERVEPIKDSKGVQTGTRTMYHQEVTYTFNAFAEVNLYKGLKFRTAFGVDLRNERQGTFNGSQSSTRAGAPANASYMTRYRFNWTLQNMLMYDTRFGGKHAAGSHLGEDLQGLKKTFLVF